MPVSFSHIPANWKQPLYWVEIDSSKAGLPVFRMPALLVGIKATAGTALPDVPVPVQSPAVAEQLFGKGSHLTAICKAFFNNNASQETWALPVAEPTGTTATGTITITAAASAPGVLSLYIAGQLVPVAVAVADTVTNIGANIVAAINANADLSPRAIAPRWLPR